MSLEIEDELISQDYLIHHGVKGMKWGVRRYQNKDGSLTNRGLKAQNKIDRKINSQKRLLQAQKDELRDYEKNRKLFSDPKRKKQAVDKAMRDSFGNDYRDKDYIEEWFEKPFKETQRETYLNAKKYYSDSKTHTRYKEVIQETQEWLKKNGNVKITDMNSKKEYKNFIRGYYYG